MGRALAAILLTLAVNAFGAKTVPVGVEVPDCYAASGLSALRGLPDGAVIVLLDETVVFDQRAQQEIIRHFLSLIRPGYSLSAFRFSAYIDDRYLTPAFSFEIGKKLTQDQLEDVRKPVAKAFAHCLEITAIRAPRRVKEGLDEYFRSANAELRKSEIVAAIREVGRSVLPDLKGKKKVIFLVSDMLEHSALTSFYSRGGVRKIDPDAEMAKVERAELLGNLRGAEVYVLGAGVLPPDPKRTSSKAYREQEKMDELRQFWANYFEKSNGKLIEFGTPLLLAPIR